MGIEHLRAAAMLAALVAPGVALFRHLGRGLRLTERFLIALALAPLALTLPALALALFAHLTVARCLWPAEFIGVVAALWPRRSRGAAPEAAQPLPERGQGFPALAAVATAAGAAFLVAAVALSGAFVLVSGDAWAHAAAVTEIVVRGLPPQDPNFAGIPLYDPWLYHFILALFGLAALAGCGAGRNACELPAGQEACARPSLSAGTPGSYARSHGRANNRCSVTAAFASSMLASGPE